MDVGCKFMRYRWGLENVLARGESVRDAVDVCDCTSMAVTCVGVEWMARSLSESLCLGHNLKEEENDQSKKRHERR